MSTKTLLRHNQLINQQVIEQCRRICESKTFDTAEEIRRKLERNTPLTRVDKTRLKNSEDNRRFLNVLVNAWVKGEKLTDLEVRKRLDITTMDTEDSSMRKRSKQVRLALRTYYLGTQYEEAEGGLDSIEIGIDRGFNIDVWSRRGVSQQVSDVLATYRDVPAYDICARIDSPTCTHIRVCLTGFVELKRWKPRLIAALKRTVTMEFVFAHPKSPFIELRATSLSQPQSDLEDILDENRKTIKEIISTAAQQLQTEQQPEGKLGAITLKWTDSAMPVPYAQIDDAIYVGAFWLKCAVGDGPFLLFDALSSSGKFYHDQFRQVWDKAMFDRLEGNEIPPMSKTGLATNPGIPK